MRQRISDKNVFPSFDIMSEYKKLRQLFHEENAFGYRYAYGNSHTILSYRDVLENIFLDWDLKGTFTSVKEMLCNLEISDKDFEGDPSEERLLDYIQFLINACAYVFSYVSDGSSKYYHDREENAFNTISSLSNQFLEKFGAELIDDEKELWVIYKDDVATAIAVQNPEIRISIQEYLKIDNRGDLDRKSEILCTLAKKLEPHESKFNGTEFKTLCSETTMLLNGVGPRHALNEKDHIKRKALAMTAKEQEEWYNRAFQMFLACMALLPYLEFKNEIKELKREE